MKTARFIIFFTFSAILLSCNGNSRLTAEVKISDSLPTPGGELKIFPVKHASFVLETGGIRIFLDPYGGKTPYTRFKKPDIILITDIHRDHLSVETIDALKTSGTIIIGPEAVRQKYPKTTPLKNGESRLVNGIKIEAIPMYNTTPGRTGHTKGRGNGYVLSIQGKRIYISGDTEDIPEMRALKNIYAAFVCMNLPYTMTENQAASAVLEFKPQIVYPFHYRSRKKDGSGYFMNIQKFKKLVSVDKNIDVRFLKWY